MVQNCYLHVHMLLILASEQTIVIVNCYMFEQPLWHFNILVSEIHSM